MSHLGVETRYNSCSAPWPFRVPRRMPAGRRRSPSSIPAGRTRSASSRYCQSMQRAATYCQADVATLQAPVPSCCLLSLLAGCWFQRVGGGGWSLQSVNLRNVSRTWVRGEDAGGERTHGTATQTRAYRYSFFFFKRASFCFHRVSYII